MHERGYRDPAFSYGTESIPVYASLLAEVSKHPKPVVGHLFLECRPKPLPYRLTPDMEPLSRSGLCADMRKSLKIKGFRLVIPALPPIFNSEPPKLNEPGLIGVQGQSDPAALLAQQEIIQLHCDAEIPLQNQRQYRTMITSPTTYRCRHDLTHRSCA